VTVEAKRPRPQIVRRTSALLDHSEVYASARPRSKIRSGRQFHVMAGQPTANYHQCVALRADTIVDSDGRPSKITPEGLTSIGTQP